MFEEHYVYSPLQMTFMNRLCSSVLAVTKSGFEHSNKTTLCM